MLGRDFRDLMPCLMWPRAPGCAWICLAERMSEPVRTLPKVLQNKFTTALDAITRSRMALRRLSRPLCLNAKYARALLVTRPFSVFSRNLQRTTQQEDEKTTHFGFETVPEAEKEARGRLDLPSSMLVTALADHGVQLAKSSLRLPHHMIP